MCGDRGQTLQKLSQQMQASCDTEICRENVLTALVTGKETGRKAIIERKENILQETPTQRRDIVCSPRGVDSACSLDQPCPLLYAVRKPEVCCQQWPSLPGDFDQKGRKTPAQRQASYHSTCVEASLTEKPPGAWLTHCVSQGRTRQSVSGAMCVFCMDIFFAKRHLFACCA